MPISDSPAAPNLKVLDEGAALIAELSDEDFRRCSPLAPEGSIGKHLRHCLDFYDCFLAGLSSGKVDYNRRDRNERAEVQRPLALARLREIVSRLETLEAGMPRMVLVREEAAPGDPEPLWCGSTPQRELQFLLSHTVHHFALVAILMRSFGLAPGEEFGMAPSTLRHRREMEHCLTS